MRGLSPTMSSTSGLREDRGMRASTISHTASMLPISAVIIRFVFVMWPGNQLRLSICKRSPPKKLQYSLPYFYPKGKKKPSAGEGRRLLFSRKYRVIRQERMLYKSSPDLGANPKEYFLYCKDLQREDGGDLSTDADGVWGDACDRLTASRGSWRPCRRDRADSTAWRGARNRDAQPRYDR